MKKLLVGILLAASVSYADVIVTIPGTGSGGGTGIVTFAVTAGVVNGSIAGTALSQMNNAIAAEEAVVTTQIWKAAQYPLALTNPAAPGPSDHWVALNGDIQDTEFFDVAYDSINGVIFGGTQDNSTPVQIAPNSTPWISMGSGDVDDIGVRRVGGDGQVGSAPALHQVIAGGRVGNR